jgi:F0F1-type ATP synthase membrane subunit b/b'
MQAERDKLEQEVTEARKSARREADEVLALTHERAGAIIKEAEEELKPKSMA